MITFAEFILWLWRTNANPRRLVVLAYENLIECNNVHLMKVARGHMEANSLCAKVFSTKYGCRPKNFPDTSRKRGVSNLRQGACSV